MKTIKYIGAADNYTDPVLSYSWDNGQTRNVTDTQWQSLLNAGRFVDATPYQNPVYDVTSTVNPITGEVDISAPVVTHKYHLREFLVAGEEIDPTGTTSMRAIIQRAIDALNAEYVPGTVKVIVLPEGRFGLSSNLTWRSGVGLMGVEQTVSKLVPLGNFAAIRAEAVGVYYEDLFFSDFEIDCSLQQEATFDSALKGFYLKRLRRAAFRRVTVRNASATAFGNDFLEGVVYDQCTAINSGRAAVDVYGAGAGFGIALGLSPLESCLLIGCKSSGHGSSGLYLEFSPSNGATYQARGISAQGFIAENGQIGVVDAGAGALQMVGGSITGNAVAGVIVTQNGASDRAGTQGRLKGLLISDNGASDIDYGGGVVFAESAGGVEYEIDGCDIVANAGHGVVAHAPVALTVANQTQITDNGACGVLVQTYETVDRLRIAGDCRIARNGQGAAAFRDGVCIDAPTDSVRVKGVMVYDDQGTPTQQKPIAFRGPHTSLTPRVEDNDLRGGGVSPVRIEHTISNQTRIAENDADAGSESSVLVTNEFTNPRFQVATSGTALSNCSASRPAVGDAVAGTNVFRATCSNTALAQASLAPMSVTPGDRITFSASLRCTSGREVGLAIKDNVTTSQYWTSKKHIAGGGWRRVSFTWVVPAGVTEIRPSFWRYSGNGAVSGDVLDIDAIMWTAGDRLHPYFDGATNGGAWTGSADASTSTKTI